MSGAALPGFFVKVVRLPRPSLPWVWEVRREGDDHLLRRSAGGFRSGDEAFAAGRTALSAMAREDDPTPAR